MIQEKWVYLSYSDLAEVLAVDEITKLDEISLSVSIEDICQKQLDSVADSFRGSFQSKGYTIDVRSHYLPNSYRMYALALARYFIWTRFPNSKEIALDEPRKELFDTAQELLKNPYIAVPTPDYSDDPELSGRTDLTTIVDDALTLPFLRILPSIPNYGFVQPYKDHYQLSAGNFWL